jgi:hypothetical protein
LGVAIIYSRRSVPRDKGGTKSRSTDMRWSFWLLVVRLSSSRTHNTLEDSTHPSPPRPNDRNIHTPRSANQIQTPKARGHCRRHHHHPSSSSSLSIVIVLISQQNMNNNSLRKTPVSPHSASGGTHHVDGISPGRGSSRKWNILVIHQPLPALYWGTVLVS